LETDQFGSFFNKHDTIRPSDTWILSNIRQTIAQLFMIAG
jgi:hypothetical protein